MPHFLSVFSIPPLRTGDEGCNVQYTGWRALFPETFILVLTLRADCSLVLLKLAHSWPYLPICCPVQERSVGAAGIYAATKSLHKAI
jgi:hypothetical protein